MAEQKAEGVVFRKNPKEWNDKVFYSFKFDGQDNWYRLGEDEMVGVVEPGFTVRIGYETDDRGNHQVVPGHIKLVKKGDPIKPSGGGGGARRSGGGGGGKPGGANMSKEEWAEKDLTIQYQAARNSALSLVELLLKTESVKLPAKTKYAERQVAIDGLVDFYTAKFFTDIAGRSAVGRSAGELEVQAELPEDTTADEPSGEDWDENGDNNTGESANEWD